MAKRSFWAWGMDSDEPTVQAKQEAADLNRNPPRIKPNNLKENTYNLV